MRLQIYYGPNVGADESEIKHRMSNGADLCSIFDMNLGENPFWALV